MNDNDPDQILEELRTIYNSNAWMGPLATAVRNVLAAYPDPKADVTITVTDAEARSFCDYFASRAQARQIHPIHDALYMQLTNRNPR